MAFVVRGAWCVRVSSFVSALAEEMAHTVVPQGGITFGTNDHARLATILKFFQRASPSEGGVAFGV